MFFERAKPTWAEGRQGEMNCELALRAACGRAEKGSIRVATSCVYRVMVNGNFVAAGPARAGHGFFRVDEIDLTPWLTGAENVITIDAVGYCVNSYDTLDQPSFVTAEITLDGRVAACTGENTMPVYDLGQRVRRVERYSFQRAFAEAYRMRAAMQAFYTDPAFSWAETAAAEQPEVHYLPREVPMPCFETVRAAYQKGGAALLNQPTATQPKTCCPAYSADFRGYPADEQEVHLTAEGAGIRCLTRAAAEGAHWRLYSFPQNVTGFLTLRIRCPQATRVYALFDELLTAGDVDFLRLVSCSCFRCDLDAGTHTVRTLAPFTMQHVKLVCDAPCTVEDVSMTEYRHPPVSRRVKLPEDAALHRIAAAAESTFLQNAVDLFTDCPSRERAGWLCDSFFTARVEHVLTGENTMERAFLRNFLLAETFPHLPKGMLPMCWPADHDNGNFIPNWAMWFVLEMEEYAARTGDRDLTAEARSRILALVDYFRAYEHADGLLEGLDGWVFVEWSRANDPDVVQDVNFPTNMLYARMLRAVAALYDLPDMARKADAVRQTIREKARDGLFFTDNLRREKGGLVNPGNHTEVCQYYAFFTGVATREEDGALWDCLVRDFGPERGARGLWPEVAAANAFIGYYLRLEMLYRAGAYDEVIRNIRGYFGGMADTTGTLWEFDAPKASCCHGFASHVLYWLAGIYGTEAVLPGKGKNDIASS